LSLNNQSKESNFGYHNLKYHIMQIEQIYTGCLAQGAYYITSNGEAAIIDPLREVQPYLDRLERDKVSLKYIFETHFHADFVSGHVDLAKATQAKIVYGPTAKPEFEAIVAADEQIFEVGKIKIKVLHTPGHTMESTTFLLIDENGKDHAIFSGDTLFIGDVGRPDLAQKAASMTQEELAATLFHSLRNKIMTLADDVIVYPAHGAGSACGKNMSKETVSTVGNQKATNYALRANMTEAEFIKEVTDGLLPPPAYFGMNVAMNKKGYESFENVLNNGMRAIPVAQLELMVEETRALILDTRNNAVFAQGFIPQSINIGIDGDFAPWVGALIADVKQPIILVTSNGREEETVTRLSRVGFDNLIGHLEGGFEAWQNAGHEIDTVNRITAEEFEKQVTIGESKIIDIRKESEYEAEHVEDAYSKPLAYINEWVKDINPEEHFFLHCAGGYRSMIAASILEARGFRNFSEVEGGFNAIAKTTVPKTNFVCQSKVLK
jgi:glyoxylase-like metal-dependent hydrolase (beta-lactamase superfamily II)/rhodanese-related sulfurtransferase